MSSIRKLFKTTKRKARKVKNSGEEIRQHDTQASMENLGKVFKELECPVCFNTCIPPIHSCINGHIICKNCRRSVLVCPSCRHGFTGTRNFFAENFIMNCSQTCKYASEGCEFLKLKGENMKPHEQVCMFRPVKCLIPSCKHDLSYKSVLRHLQNEHQIMGTDTIPALISFYAEQPITSNRKWLPYAIETFGCIFYVMMEVMRPHFWIWVWHQSINNEESRVSSFSASVSINNNDKTLKLEWEGPVHSIRTSEETIKNEGLCMVCHEAFMQHCNLDGNFNLLINIKQVKNEAISNHISRHSLYNSAIAGLIGAQNSVPAAETLSESSATSVQYQAENYTEIKIDIKKNDGE